MVHQSFVDFLVEEEVDLRATHDRVASFYLSAWGGLDAGLPALFDPRGEGELEDYGLRHLAEHLERAGRVDDLHRLLRLERRGGGVEAGTARAENAWYAARERVGQTQGYMNDLARAARLVQVADRPDVKPSQLKTSIGLGIRYALMSASLNSLARNIPPTLIAALVEKGVWLASQGLAYARVLSHQKKGRSIDRNQPPISDHHERATVLRETLGRVAPGDRRRRVPGRRLEALGHGTPGRGRPGRAGAGSGAGDRRARGPGPPPLAALGQVEGGMEVARGIGDEGSRARALKVLWRHPPGRGRARVEQALGVARGIGDEGSRARAWRHWARWRRRWKWRRGIGDEGSRALALMKMAPHLPDADRVRQSLAMALTIEDNGPQILALVGADASPGGTRTVG